MGPQGAPRQGGLASNRAQAGGGVCVCTILSYQSNLLGSRTSVNSASLGTEIILILITAPAFLSLAAPSLNLKE